MVALGLAVIFLAPSQNASALAEFLAKSEFKQTSISSESSASRIDFLKLTYGGLGQAGGQQGNPARGKNYVVPKPPPPTVRNELQFILSPTKLSSEPTWPDLKNPQHMESAYLGANRQGHLYGKAPIPILIEAQRALNLNGGMDWRRLAALGTTIRDYFPNTSSICVHYFDKAQPEAIAFLTGVVTLKPKNFGEAIQAIGLIEGPEATLVLRNYYRDSREEIARAAMSALCNSPYREAAKDEYMDMIARKVNVSSAASAAAKFGWTDALPGLENYLAGPCSLHEFIWTLEYQRALAGSPVPKEVKESARGSYENKTLAERKAILLAHPDKELIVAYAIQWSRLRSKVDTSTIQAVGQEMLNALPQDVVKSVTSRIKGND